MKRAADDPNRSAVALAYKETDAAPRVVAKGRGLIADEIIARAKEHGIFVHDSPELVGLLMQIDLDERIPPQLYTAVAELLAWLYSLEHGGAASPLDPLGRPVKPVAHESPPDSAVAADAPDRPR